MADNLPDKKEPYKAPQPIGEEYQPGAGSTFEPGEVYEEMAEKRAAEAEEQKAQEAQQEQETQQPKNENLSDEQQQQRSIQLQQTYAKRQKQFKQQVKPLEDEIKELNSALFKLKIAKIFSKFADIGNFIARSVAFTAPLWFTIIIFIIEFLVIVPGIVFFVLLGILKGPATKKIEQLIKKTNEEIKAKQTQVAKERQKMGLDQLEAQM